MPLPHARNRTPAALGAIVVRLADHPPAEGGRAFTYEVVVLDAQGERADVLAGDLAPHLTPGQVTALNNFLDALRAKAAEVLA